MLVAQVHIPGEPLRLVDIPIPDIDRGEVLIRIAACGVCHSDLHIIDGDWSVDGFPKIPGHEVAGVVERVGSDVSDIRIGDHVGVPWVYSTCGHCEACIVGDDPLCADKKVTGLMVPGGFGEYMKAPARSITRIPEGLSFEAAAPLFCAGLTSFSGLRLAAIQPGERVAVHGIGGLGHLAIQIAKQFGAHVIALTSTKDKVTLCRELGADECLVGDTETSAEALRSLGGAHVIFSSAPVPASLGNLVPAMARNGRMIVVGAGAGSMSIRPKDLIHRRLRIMGSPVGTRGELAELLALAAAGKISVRTKSYPLNDVNHALSDLRNRKAQCRIVLIP